MEFCRRSPFLSHAEEEESDRTVRILQAIAFSSHVETRRKRAIANCGGKN
ncbi:hypothetical protein [Nostoc sp. DSM 114167]